MIPICLRLGMLRCTTWSQNRQVSIPDTEVAFLLPQKLLLLLNCTLPRLGPLVRVVGMYAGA